MEHILEPEDATRFYLEIPYICGDAFEYDPEAQFLQYGLDLGWDKKRANDIEDDSYADELAVVLQKWLFFGLITEFFGTANVRIKTGDLVDRARSDHPVITTALLNQLLQEWARNIRILPPEQRTAVALIIPEYLKEAQVCLKYLGGRLEAPLSLVILSISTVGTAMAFAQRHVFRPGGTCPVAEWTDHLSYRGWGKSRLMVERLISNGWCEYEIGQLYGENFSTIGIVFAASLERPRRIETHEKCSEKICRAFQVDEVSYKTRHVEEDCTCSHLEIDHRDLCSILKSGQFAIIKLERSDSGFLQVLALPYRKGVKYVAMSHVWSDGLGNAAANSLPTCQLERLDYLARRMHPTTEKQPIYIWIDTLCVTAQEQTKTCPTENGELNCRQLAIRRMNDTYREASAVLTLDWELQQSLSATKPEESLLRILVSAWMRRLWTFQEARLSQNLYIQFKDRAIRLEELLFSLDMPDHKPLWSEVGDAYLSTREGIMNNAGGSQRLGFLWNALQGRTTSHASDEAVVLGTMLGMDITPILKADDGQRMFTLLSSLDIYPSQIVFMPGPRVDRPGYGWAPTSFLGRQQWTTATALGDNLLSSAEAHTMNVACAPAFRADSGLLLRAPGFISQPFDEPLCHFYSIILEDGRFMGVCLYLEEQDGPDWYERGIENHDNIGIVIDGERGEGYAGLAALVSDCQMQGGILFAKFVCRLWFGANRATESPPSQTSAVDENSGERYSTVFRAKKVPQDQMWCIG